MTHPQVHTQGHTQGHTPVAGTMAGTNARASWARHATSETHDAEAATGTSLVDAAGRALPLREVTLDAHAGQGFARVVVMMRFENVHDERLAVTYRMPLPPEGAVSGYAFSVDGREVRGVVQPRREARETYEAAIAGGHAAGLLDQERANVFTQRLGNLPPRATLVATITVDLPLAWLGDEGMGGAWELRLPTVIGPRYVSAGVPASPTEEAGAVDVEVSEDALPLRAHMALTIRDALVAGRRPESPSHVITSEPALADAAHAEASYRAAPRREQTAVRFASHAGERLDRDVVVRWPVGARDVGLSLGTARPAEGAPLAEHAYGVLTLVPPVPEAAARSLPRDLTVLIDTSGSMGGFPLDCAKVAVGLLLASLGEGDRFELVEFNSARRAFREGMSRVTPDATRAALTWVGALEAGGATEMHTAVLEAMRALRGGAQRQVVLVTDGYVGGEEEIVRTLLSELPRGCRLHFVGVGAAVNRALGLAMSRAGRGVECVIAGGDDPERALATLLRGTSAPVLTDVELSGSALVERAPEHLPDVFAGSPLRVAVKLAPAGGRLTLRGETAAGRWERVIDVPATAPGEGDPGLVALFARERVADLETRVAGGGSTRSFDKEIERLGVLFQISTRLTSWVAVDARVSVEPASAGREESVPQEVPHGTTIEGFGLRAASTSGGAFQETDLLSLATGSFGALAGPTPSSVSQAARGGVALGAAPPPQMARASHAMPTGAPMPMPSAAPRRSRAWVFALLLVLLLLGAALTFLLLRR